MSTVTSMPEQTTNAQVLSRDDRSPSWEPWFSLRSEMHCADAVAISLMPRGSTQIVQPQRVAEPLLKTYQSRLNLKDQLTWQAIQTNQAVKGDPHSEYVKELLYPLGYSYVAVAPLQSPVLEGYPGAIQVFRSEQQGDFTEADLRRLQEIARKLDREFSNTRAARAGAKDGLPAWLALPSIRAVVLNALGKPLAFASAFHELDERIRQQLIEDAARRIERLGDDEMAGGRLVLPDIDGDSLTLNAIAYANYPAIAPGPVVVYCLLPVSPEWAVLRASDLNADPEVARLVPAMKFMQEHFREGPKLIDIALTAHLSPFHFHRRFTHLMGLTPKHFMLECQIHESKTALAKGEKELPELANDCGFAHQSHFTSRFKQATGLTPTRWRRMAINRMSAGN